MRTCRIRAVVVPLLLTLTGCGGTDALTFNNAIAKTSRDLEAAVEKFSASLANEENPARLRAAHDELAAATHKIVAEAQSIKVPASQDAQELWTTFQAFMDTQEKTVVTGFKEIVEIKVGPNPDTGKMQQIYRKMQAEQARPLARLRAQQAAFARANGFKIR